MLHRAVQGELLQVMPAYWSRPDHLAALQRGFVAIAPGLLVLVHYGLRCIVRADGGWRTRALLAASFLFGEHIDSVQELLQSHFTWRPRS